LTERLPPGVTFAGMTAGTAPAEVDGALVWTLGRVDFGGLRLGYRLRPGRPGSQALGQAADLDYLDGLGRGGWVRLGIPWVTVLDPQRLPTPAPTATPVPRRVFLPISQRDHCISLQQHADVMLVLDTSTSMNEPTPGGRTKLAASIAAAQAFVGLLQPPRDQVGLVVFDSEATVLAPLAPGADRVRLALDALTTAPGTRIDRGLEAAGRELTGPAARPGSGAVIVLLTDGRPTGVDDETVLARAAAARASGIEIFTVGLGGDVDPDFLARVADDANHRFISPDGTDLDRIYRHIAGVIPCR
jgi:uncharacterized protein YegL